MDNDELQGWEKSPSVPCLIDYAYLNFRGKHAPRVGVVKKEVVYQISIGKPANFMRNSNYGGHHRSIAHRISGNLLECSLMDEHEDPSCIEFVTFSDIREVKISPMLTSLDEPFGRVYLNYLYSIFNGKIKSFSDTSIHRFASYYNFNVENSEKLYELLMN